MTDQYYWEREIGGGTSIFLLDEVKRTDRFIYFARPSAYYYNGGTFRVDRKALERDGEAIRKTGKQHYCRERFSRDPDLTGYYRDPQSPGVVYSTEESIRWSARGHFARPLNYIRFIHGGGAPVAVGLAKPIAQLPEPLIEALANEYREWLARDLNGEHLGHILYREMGFPVDATNDDITQAAIDLVADDRWETLARQVHAAAPEKDLGHVQNFVRAISLGHVAINGGLGPMGVVQ